MARVLWMSDSPRLATGFGLVTGEVCKRLAGLGHEILVLGWWSSEPAEYFGLDIRPCPVHPKRAAAAVVRHASQFRPHYLITLGDIPWLGYLAAADVRRALSQLGTKWCIYYPVDGALPDGGLPANWVSILSEADLAVTMSEFGTAATTACGIDATFIPHGCDTELFCPPRDKEAAKRRFGYEGKFVILSDMRNHRRKMIPRALDIVRRLQVPPDKLVFHLHTGSQAREDADSYSYNVRADIELLGLGFVTGIHDNDDPAGFGMAELVSLYSAADVHLLTSFGEGFGLPTLQAASSGVVPIAAANSASTELAGSHGYAIPCDTRTTDEFGLVRKFIDRRRAASVLQALYEDPRLLDARALAARRFALDFSWDHVVRKWDFLLREEEKTPLSETSGHRAGRAPAGASLQRIRGLNGARRGKQAPPRPTGHDASVLPVPRIGVPVRLELKRKAARGASIPLVLAEASCAHQLRDLEAIFPGTLVLNIDGASLPARDQLQELIDMATLVVDPEGRLPQIDLLCATRGASYLGNSAVWPPVAEGSLLLKARSLLTDYALSEKRARIARQRVRRAVPAAFDQATKTVAKSTTE